MKNKKLYLLVLLCATFLLFMGCEQKDVESSDLTASVQEDMTLTVYLDSYTKDYMTGLVDQFVREHPEVRVNVEDYSDMIIPDYRKKLVEDLLAGGGPDVILAANTTNNTVQDLTKLLQNEVFLNLDTLDLDVSACAPQVLKAGKYNGGQYLIPLNYSLGHLLTTEERLEKYGIDITSDLEAFASSLAAIYDADKMAFLDIFTIEFLYRQNGLNFIDHKAKNLSSSQEHIDAMQRVSSAYCRLFPNAFADNNADSYRFLIYQLKNYNYSVEEAFLAGDLVFFSAPAFMGAYENLWLLNGVGEKILEAGETPVLFTLPTLDGQNASPCVNYFLLANKNTGNSEAVKLFMESAIGVASQYQVSSQLGIPVNTDLVDYMREFYLDGIVHETYGFTDNCSFPLEMTESYFSAIDTMVDGIYIDAESCGKLFAILREYDANGGDIAAAYAVGKQQLETYLAD